MTDTLWQPVDAVNSALGAQLMSEYRVNEGLKSVAVIPSLQQPAEAKARDMATRDYAAHDDPPGAFDAPAGRTWFARDEAYGYTGALGEVIAWGTEYVNNSDPAQGTTPMSPAEAIREWTATVGEAHYVTIHIADYNACGYAVAVDKSGSAFHVCVFGVAASLPKPPSPPPPPVPAPAPAVPIGSKWRAKLNPLAKPVTVVKGPDPSRVYAQNAKGVPLNTDGFTLAQWTKKYVQV